MGRPKKGTKGVQHGWYTDAKKIEVVTAYLVLGKSNLVEAATGVSQGTVRVWKQQPWWAEMVNSIQTESDQELDAKLAKRIEKVLDIVNDRLEKGDFMYDPKTGAFIRKPVNLKDSWRVGSEMVDKRWLIRKLPKEQGSQEAIGDILKDLAAEFAAMAKSRIKAYKSGAEQIKEAGDPQLQERVPELPREAGTD